MAVIKVYTRINWLNKSESLTTPLGKTNLNKMDKAINLIDDEVVSMSAKIDEIDTTKVSADQLNDMVTDVSFNDKNGVISITKHNGTVLNIDTAMEKIAVNFEYNAQTQQLILTLENGEKQYIDMSALITQYEFKDTDTIAFSVDSSGKVSASIKSGSITKAMLSSEIMASITLSENNAAASAKAAAQSATNAELDAKLSQSYSVGKSGIRDGEDTDNSKYYSEQAKKYADEAQEIAGGNFIPNSEKGIAGGVAVLNANLAVEKAVADENGNNIQNTYATQQQVPTLVKVDDKTITKDEDGTLHGAMSIEIDSELSEKSENPVQNKVITKSLEGKSDSNHTHLYAGSNTAGGIANSSNLVYATSHPGTWYQNSQWDGTYFQTNYKYGDSVLPMKVGYSGHSDNSGKVNNHTVNSDVPANAVFTDTIYTLPTASGMQLGGVKTGSNIKNDDGVISISKENVVAALGYTPAQGTGAVSGVKGSAESSYRTGNVNITAENVRAANNLKFDYNNNKLSLYSGSKLLSTVLLSSLKIPERIVTFADGTDDEIAAMLDAHYKGLINVSDYWAVGDTRKVNLPTIDDYHMAQGSKHRAQTVEYVIADFNHDTLTTPINNHTMAAVTLTQRNCLMDAACEQGSRWGSNNYENVLFNTSTPASGWEKSTIRNWCNNNYYNALPNKLKSMLKQVNKLSFSNAYNSSYTELTTTSDYVFLLSEIEIFGDTNYSLAGEGSKYKYFNTSGNIYKLPKYSASAYSSRYWLRSQNKGTQTNDMIVVSEYGGMRVCTAIDRNGIAPCICL